MAQILTQRRVKELPRVFPLRQFFPRPKIENIEDAVAVEIQKLFPRGDELRGKVIGVTAPSRGIQQVVRLLRAVVAALRPLAKKIVIVPGIGSHGGGSATLNFKKATP